MAIKPSNFNIFEFFKSLYGVFLKVRENKVPSEFGFFNSKYDFLVFLCFPPKHKHGSFWDIWGVGGSNFFLYNV